MCMLRRYMRGMRLRWPLKKFTNGRPVDLINFELKAALLAAGYAVVTIDVRGTGACSFRAIPMACQSAVSSAPRSTSHSCCLKRKTADICSAWAWKHAFLEPPQLITARTLSFRCYFEVYDISRLQSCKRFVSNGDTKCR